MPDPAPTSAQELADRLAADVATASTELAEIDLLLQQARSESVRHEQRAEQAAERLASLSNSRNPGLRELAEANQQVVTLTRKVAVMQGSIDVLEGKHKLLARHRDRLEELHKSVETLMFHVAPTPGAAEGGGPQLLAPAVSRIVLTAQEDLRRDIARAMHDGPAQSLTNIVLQAQIVRRLMDRDVELARAEIGELVQMVERTLEATKTFIFDVRPMVLDDLGLVPTLRRAARDRSRHAQVPIEFDSVGADRRLPIDVESTLFRIIDEALVGFLSARPERVALRLDWSDRLVAIVEVPYTPAEEAAAVETAAGEVPTEGIPPALAAMMREQTAAERPRTRPGAETALPAETWREARERASTISADITLAQEGHRLRLAVDLTPEV